MPMTAPAAWSCPGRSSRNRSKARQAVALPAGAVEIRRIEPAFEGRAQYRPFPVDNREPGGVAVAPAGHCRLAEQPLIAEAEAQRRRPAWRVQGIAFPLLAAVAELVGYVPPHST